MSMLHDIVDTQKRCACLAQRKPEKFLNYNAREYDGSRYMRGLFLHILFVVVSQDLL